MRSIMLVGYMIYHYLVTWRTRKKYAIGSGIDKREGRIQIYKEVKRLAIGMLRMAGTRVIVKGKENLPKEGPVLYVMNHQSNMDAVVLISELDDPIIPIGKVELEKFPIIGTWIKALGGISLVRDDMRSSLKAIMEGIEELKGGQSVLIFPEGTRSKGGEIAEFKAGSFKLATKSNVPIVPIACQNVYKILEEKGRIKKAEVYMTIGEVIVTSELSAEEKKNLHVRVEDCIRTMQADMNH